MAGPPEVLASGTRFADLTVVALLATDRRSCRYAARAGDDSPVELTVSREPLEALGLGRFRREVEDAARLRIPGAVPILGGGVYEDHGYVVHAPSSGISLADILADGSCGSRAVDLLLPAARALDALHALGRVHHLLTPDAFVVDEAGGGLLRLTGVERFFPEPVAATGGGDVGERAVYQAPETIAGAVVSHRSDLFAFACVAFEAVTGSPPLTMDAVLGRTPGPPRASDRLPGLPSAVDATFRRALATNPMDRHASAADLVDELGSAFGVTYRPLAGRSLRRLVWLSGIAALVGIVAVVVVLIVT